MLKPKTPSLWEAFSIVALALVLTVALTLGSGANRAHAQDAAVVARGNMHFDAKAMDANGDGMISKDEMLRYGETSWEKLSLNAKRVLPVSDAASDFARGNLKFDAHKMDANGDGQITREEFLKYAGTQFDHAKPNAKGLISVADAARNFGRGNQMVAE